MVVRSQAAAYRTCYEAGLARNRELTGRVDLRFIIEPSGKVSEVTVPYTDLPNCDVVRCIRRTVQSLEFARSEGGQITVVYPYMLEPDKDAAP